MLKPEKLDVEIFSIASDELAKEIEVEILEEEEKDLTEYIAKLEKEEENDK